MSLVHDHNQISKTNLQEKVIGKVELSSSDLLRHRRHDYRGEVGSRH